jgi:hypothetical protein
MIARLSLPFGVRAAWLTLQESFPKPVHFLQYKTFNVAFTLLEYGARCVTARVVI